MIKRMISVLLCLCLLFSASTTVFGDESYKFNKVFDAYSVLTGKITEVSKDKIKLAKISDDLWSKNLAPQNTEYIMLDTTKFQGDEFKKDEEIKVYFEYLVSDYRAQEEDLNHEIKLLFYQEKDRILSVEDKARFLEKIGVLSGYEDGELHLDRNMTRAEFTLLVLKLYDDYQIHYLTDDEYSIKTVLPFEDVPKEHWARKYIAYAYETEVINGKSEKTFAPDDNITIQDSIVVLLGANAKGQYQHQRLLDRANELGGYPNGYLKIAEKYGLLTDQSPKKIATRGDIVPILYNAYTHETNVGFMFNARKPVIYLYPEKETNINVEVSFDGAFTFTYPEYKKGWNVTASPDGTLLREGASYPYLFWEGNLLSYTPKFDEGFLVSKEETVPFLEEKLRVLGLNDKERADFITYWAPQLMKNDYNIIKFDSEAYTSVVSLNIAPQPDSMIRVFMIYKAASGKESIEKQELKPAERTGFVAVEWGGIAEE